ncbi:MAG: glycoside hydrolase family 30 protein [Cyclobacteriaceae bacterium]|nr:glycoside hydrolase family 30 protein [Cyclobacteriaceae bacterium]
MKKSTLINLLPLLIWCSCNQSETSNNIEGRDTTNSTSIELLLYTTADSTQLRITLVDTLRFTEHLQPLETETCVFVDSAQTFQTFLGIGGAITDASAEAFAKLSNDQQQALLTAYFDPRKGIGYTLARTHINSCDFSSASYTYVQDNDIELKTFNIAHDKQFRIPLIQKAIAAAGGELTTYVSPWSPPAWMKDNNDLLHGGKLKPEYFQSWANYFVQFIKAYEAQGIPIWGLTVQNEPMAKQIWESCIFSAEEERDFVKNYLGPTLGKNGLQDRKLIVWDHNRDLIYHRAQTIFNDTEASKYIWGMGFHWYEDWSGGNQMFDNVKRVHESWPDKNLIFTEGCNFPFEYSKITDWKWGERYGLSMINDFNNGTVAWTDWNILLDETGGPNHVKNFCMAPIHADTRTDKLIFSNSYYYIGHFSKFLKKGAKRMAASASRSNLLTTAFINPDGEQVVIVMNATNQPIKYQLMPGKYSASLVAQPHSISTMLIH